MFYPSPRSEGKGFKFGGVWGKRVYTGMFGGWEATQCCTGALKVESSGL